MNDQLNRLITNLINDTQGGRIRWSSSSVRDEFRLDLQTGVLLLSKTTIPESKIVLHFFRRLGDDQVLCEARLDNPDYGPLSTLYGCVHNSFSVTVDTLLSELSLLSKK